MAFTPELIDELELLALFNLNNTQEGLKVHHTADGKAVAAARRLHDKGLIDFSSPRLPDQSGAGRRGAGTGPADHPQGLTEAAIATCSRQAATVTPVRGAVLKPPRFRAIQWHDRSQARRLALPVPGRP
jgi:uncharacterized protein (TIGR02647 family)